MTPPPAVAIDGVATWLNAVAREAWQTVWACHAPDSLLIAGYQVVPRNLVDPGTYVRCQQTILAQTAPERRWHFQPIQWGTALAVAPDLTTVTVGLLERVTGFGLTAVFLVSTAGIVGITVDPAGAPAQAEAMADLVQVPPCVDWSRMHLTALHHAFERRRIGLQATLRALPEARFTCQGRGDCCQVAKWNVSLSDNEWQAASQLPAALGLPDLRLQAPAQAPSFPSQTALDDRNCLAGTGASPACTVLGDGNRCGIHARLAWQPLPVCNTYPTMGVRTPDGIDVTTYFSCLTVCRNEGQPLGEQAVGLQQRLWSIQHRLRQIPDRLAGVSGAAATVAWSDYRDLEVDLLALLGQVATVGAEALRSGIPLVEALQGQSVTAAGTLAGFFDLWLETPDVAAAAAEPWLESRNAETWAQIRRQPVRFHTAGELLARFLRSILFRKSGLAETGVGFPWGMTLLAYRMVVEDARCRAWRAGRPETVEEDVVAAVRATEALIGHGNLSAILQHLTHGFLESPAGWEALIASDLPNG